MPEVKNLRVFPSTPVTFKFEEKRHHREKRDEEMSYFGSAVRPDRMMEGSHVTFGILGLLRLDHILTPKEISVTIMSIGKTEKLLFSQKLSLRISFSESDDLLSTEHSVGQCDE